ncbi:hypothetical protein GGX14DRAFT_441610, partial [Mycena pura]
MLAFTVIVLLYSRFLLRLAAAPMQSERSANQEQSTIILQPDIPANPNEIVGAGGQVTKNSCVLLQETIHPISPDTNEPLPAIPFPSTPLHSEVLGRRNPVRFDSTAAARARRVRSSSSSSSQTRPPGPAHDAARALAAPARRLTRRVRGGAARAVQVGARRCAARSESGDSRPALRGRAGCGEPSCCEGYAWLTVLCC